MTPKGINVIKKKSVKSDATDIALLVSTSSQEEINQWDKTKIVNSLVKETGANLELAQEIADAVERKIVESKFETITTSIIRELIDTELIQRNLAIMHKKHSHLGLPMYDVEQIIVNANKENSNTTHNPESINLTIAETILKEYALRNVFSGDVAEAHMTGDIHLHDLGFIVRPYCGGHSLDYIKKFGLDLPNIPSASKPAKHPETLIGHMVKMASTLQSHYAGAIGWEAVNMFFAPFLIDLSYKEIKQIAQMLVWEFSELAGARGSQLVFSDLNLYYGIPKHFKEAPALGPGGKYITRGINEEFVYHNEPVEGCLKYKDFERESNLFLKALFEIYLAGDAKGRTFYFPKPLLHINEDGINSEGWDEFFTLACKVASRMGITYFVFDRGDSTTISQCCRLKLKLNEKDLAETATPEKMRFSALQNVTINLPRIAYKAKGKVEFLFAELDKMIEIVAKAHLQKKDFIGGLLKLGSNGPLALFVKDDDGNPYLRTDRLTYLAGLFGLNEMVQFCTGKQLHESSEAFKLGLRIISHMKLCCEKIHEKYGIRMVLEESPAESSGYRLAKLDLKYYPEEAKKVVKGNPETDLYYYTNSIHFAYDAPIDYIDRVEMQSRFHPLVEAGSIIHIWLGENEPDPESIKNFVMKTYHNTTAEQIAFSPEFTFCRSCNQIARGLKDKCPQCGSENIDGITRIVGYFSNTSGWNKGKVAELKDRKRTALETLAGGVEDEDQVVLERELQSLSVC
ncbi:MAG: anaerobic ribonucleoside-triphosphate reductase [Actinobacteria bacterium]|nr:anaerobic ribonucleoside-triphosphate reductase [Actinomycetota bacterium]